MNSGRNIKNYILPMNGIYAVKVLIGINKKIFNGVAYFGFRPTFKGKEIFLEINIFGINKNLYNIYIYPISKFWRRRWDSNP